jgi:drug/metabolite transporter (DMT)-like permease
MTKERAKAIAITVVILILMSFGTIFSKLALTDVRPLTLTWITVAIGMIAMSLYTFVFKKEKIPHMSRQVWWMIIAIGFFNFVTGRIASMYALNFLPATTNTYLSNFIGFITMGLSILILKESPTLFQVLGAGVALGGLRVFFQTIPVPSELLGVLLVLVAILGVAFTNNIARKLSIITKNEISNNIISTLAILIGGSITVIIGLTFDHPIVIIGWKNWGIAFYLGIVTIAVGLTVWNNILRVLRSYEASILGASTVIWTALLAVPFLGEHLKLNQIIGIGLMLVGLILVQVRGWKFSELFKRNNKAEIND